MPTTIAIACQGGGSHCAYTGGVLAALLRRVHVEDGRLLLDDGRYEIVGLSGTSGGAISAYLAWLDLLRMRAGLLDASAEEFAVERFWRQNEALWVNAPPFDRLSNLAVIGAARLEGFFPQIAPSPNVFTNAIHRKLGEMIDEAAGDLGFLDYRQRGGLSSAAAKAVVRTPQQMPLLIIGAADLFDAEFHPFIGSPQYPPLTDQVLASTTLPSFFSAVQVPPCAPDFLPPGEPPRTAYWDGLFSQNPPIADLMTPEDKHAKPDEIWIVRINPAKTVRMPTLPGEIFDRRNELAGNVSLEQEKSFVRKVNEMILRDELNRDGDRRHKPIALWGMALDGPADVPIGACFEGAGWREMKYVTPLPSLAGNLDYASKLLRGPLYLRALRARGAEAVEDFLTLRTQHPAPATAEEAAAMAVRVQVPPDHGFPAPGTSLSEAAAEATDAATPDAAPKKASTARKRNKPADPSQGSLLH